MPEGSSTTVLDMMRGGARVGLASSALAFVRAYTSYSGRRGLIVAVCALTAAVLEAGALCIVLPLLGTVFASESTGPGGRIVLALFARAGLASPLARLTVLLLAFGALSLARAWIGAVRDVRLTALRLGFVAAQRLRIAEMLAAAPWARGAGLSHARIAQLMGGDIQSLGAATSFLSQGAVAATMLVAQCALALLLAPVLALFCIGVVLFGALAMVPYLRAARRLGRFANGVNRNLLDATLQFLGGLKLAISQNLQAGYVLHFRKTLRDLTARQVDFARANARRGLTATAVSVLIGAVLVLAGFGWFRVAPTVLMTLLLVVLRMNGQLAQIQSSAQQLAAILPTYDNFRALEAELSLSSPVVSAPGILAAGVGAGSIAFRDVGFSYRTAEGPRGGVRGLDLTVAPGEFLGVCGPSGAGKTTFADLLVGLIPPDTGTITVDGRPLQGGALVQWRTQLSYVSQDPFLFPDTIRHNLLWTNPNAGNEEIRAALAFAEAEALVEGLPAGLDTVVGERGGRISGGERQRIALARAILRHPRLLVLDEATNAVDAATEMRIVARVAAMARRPTVVMITHRRAMTRLCDRVLEMAAGRFVEG